MTIQDFMLEGKNAVIACLRANGFMDVIVKETEVVKANDRRMFGLNLREEGCIFGRSVYLDDLYFRYTDGEDLDMLMEEAAERCVDSMSVPPPPEFCIHADIFDDYKERLTVRLLSVKDNLCYLQDKPYIDVGNGLVLVAQINHDPSITSEWRLPVTDDLLDDLGCDKESLLTDALANTMHLEPAVFVKLEELVYSRFTEEMRPTDYFDCDGPEFCDPEAVYILSNKSMCQGASVLYYPTVMHRIYELLGCGYSVVPSSVHELLIVPDEVGISFLKLKEMLLDGNKLATDKNDLLSEHIFHYDPDESGTEGMLVTAA